MSIHHLTFKQFLPIELNKAWDFFSNPVNLATITPDEMNFTIICELPERTYAGQLITYKVSPLFNIPLKWVTEITEVSVPHFFIDEQRKGPYKKWHHEHHFKEVPGGVEMTDVLFYEIPLGLLGDLLNRLFIDQKVKSIFDYRKNVLEKLFV